MAHSAAFRQCRRIWGLGPSAGPTPARSPLLAWATLAFLALALFWASVAWACVPQPLLAVVPRASGRPGAEVTVHGLSFGPGKVEVRWNALDGPHLADSTGPDFSVSVKVPEVPTGLYALVVLTRGPDGSITQRASTAFDVRPEGNSDTPPLSDVRPTVQAGPSDGDGAWTVPSVVGISAGGLAVAIVGGLVGAKASSRRSGSPASLHAKETLDGGGDPVP